ncbi:ABC transporter permease [Neobacillus jeddahensis]|uniref:ABC transporter permease n=1 Tax=Neobacillus jeddahensis TaxID=1461580 RepID=UPI00058B251A|nr:ABC transporter permease [Neobacillus jeddahensis]
MTLFSVTKKNIQGNFKNYLIYFLSMIFSVVIYYTFVALQYNEEIQTSIQSWKMLQSVFVEASIILILFVAVFILYSNSFFTKKRKKEVGLYSLLGVRKKTVGKMLFYENLIMGAIAVIIGIFFGTILSKLFAMMLLKLLSSTVNVSFSFSIDAIINTMIVFTIIILFTSFQAYRLIYRFKLIELFRAEKEGEQVPKASIIGAGMAVALLVFSYWIVFHPITDQSLVQLSLFLVGMVCGTYLLFRSLILFLLRASQKNKASYYRSINFIGISQLLYRIKGNARTLTMIALLSAVTLCAISIGYSSYYNVEEKTKNMSPFSYMFVSKDANFNHQAKGIIMGDKEHPVQASLDIPVIQVKGDLSDLKYVPYGHSADSVPTKLISVSTYNQIMEALNKKKGNLHLKGELAAAIRPWQDNTNSDYIGHEVKLQLSKGNRTVKLEKMFEKRIVNWTASAPDIYIVVSDSLFADMTKQVKPFFYSAYKVKNEKMTKETSAKLMNLNAKDLELSTFYTAYTEELQSSGIDIFLLGFLGLVFLAATGSIIYFKQLTEAHEDKNRYNILRKIGVSKREIFTTIAQQTLFVFLLPLVIGILHSIVILKAIFGVNLAEKSIIIPIFTAIVAYVIIYLGYYLLTVRSSNKIVYK